MNCLETNKLISKFLLNDENFNDFREFYYHINSCKDCYDNLLDEYIFHEVFNDLDEDNNFNYKEKLDKKLYTLKNRILDNDKRLTLIYIFFSIIIILIFVMIFFIIVTVYYGTK